MKTTKILVTLMLIMAFFFRQEVCGQWANNGNHIYNTNSQNVGIGTGTSFTPEFKLHINNGTSTASIMCESSYTGNSNYPLGYIRLRNTATDDMFNMVLRKNGTVHEMLQSCYDATNSLWREFIYYNYGTRKYEMRNGVMDAEFKNSGNVIFNNTGNVGIGTSSPVEKLEVVGRIKDKSGFVMPVGTVLPFAGSTVPEGWLLCNGAAVSRTLYADLFAIISVTYGLGDGVSTFNLPNLLGKTVVMRDAAQSEFFSLGQSGGAKTHSLTTAQIPGHTHIVDPAEVNTGNENTAHNHQVDPPESYTSTVNLDHSHMIYGNYGTGIGGADTPTGDASIRNTDGISYNETTGNINSSHYHFLDISPFMSANNTTTHLHSLNLPATTSSSVGGGSAHNNLQPYIVLNYIIKY